MIYKNILIHVFAIFSFFFYLYYVLSNFFDWIILDNKKLIRIIFQLGLISNFIFLFFILQTEVGRADDIYIYESHPALLLILTSFVFFLALYIYQSKVALFNKFFSLGSFFIFIMGSVLLHRVGVSQVYQLSPFLIFHILVSLISQVFLVLVFILSFLMIVLDRSLKDKTLISDFSNYPPLLPTQDLWMKSLKLGIFSFILAIVTGVFQVGGIVFSYKMLFAFLSLFGLSVALIFFKGTKVRVIRITFWLSVYILIVFILQLSIRAKLIMM